MKEIKTTTTYSEEKIKTFLKIYYFERIKTTRILINILILAIIYFLYCKAIKTILFISMITDYNKTVKGYYNK